MRLFKFRRDPTDPVDRVDRYWHGRRLRLVIGLHVADDFSTVRGVVAQAHGEGKYLRLQQLAAKTAEVRPELASACRRLCQANGGLTTEFLALANDLAIVQAELINQLRGACDSVAEWLLAVCVSDPGCWSRDFDGRQLYSSFCNPDLLSSLSGVSVIDALPAKDLVAGGHGGPLTPLAVWLLLADRSSPVATYARLIVIVDRAAELIFLPVSDGLDDEYPEIRYERFVGTRWLEDLPTPSGEPAIGRPNARVHGRIVDGLLSEWFEVAAASRRLPTAAAVEAAFVARTQELLKSENLSRNDLAASSQHWSRRAWDELVERCVGRPSEPLQIYFGGSHDLSPEWESHLRQRFPDAPIASIRQLGFDPNFVDPILVAALGAMHIDQMPSNLPWLTGVETPRILGRLTPGSPNQWRKLVREMADYHPPAMRLREAV